MLLFAISYLFYHVFRTCTIVSFISFSVSFSVKPALLLFTANVSQLGYIKCVQKGMKYTLCAAFTAAKFWDA